MKKKQKLTGANTTVPLTQPDKRQQKSNSPLPNDENVELGKKGADENPK